MTIKLSLIAVVVASGVLGCLAALATKPAAGARSFQPVARSESGDGGACATSCCQPTLHRGGISE